MISRLAFAVVGDLRFVIGAPPRVLVRKLGFYKLRIEIVSSFVAIGVQGKAAHGGSGFPCPHAGFFAFCFSCEKKNQSNSELYLSTTHDFFSREKNKEA